MRLLITAFVCLCLSLSTDADHASEQPSPTERDVAYGPHTRNILDFWQATGDGPRPLLIYIHGGGWLTGDKSQKSPALQPFLDRGISVAAINYRLTPQNPLPAPVHDAARAVQFLRSRAVRWNIDTNHMALTGPSAGACTAMWLLLHDDLADPKAKDPVLRESTRVCAASVSVGQTSIDPDVIEGWLGPNVLKHPMIAQAVGETDIADVIRQRDRFHDLYVEFSPINHVDSSDPPLFMTCSAEMDLPSRDPGHGIHHPMYGAKLKEKSDMTGHECHLLIPGYSVSPKYADGNDFLFQMLLSR
ncbi:MAG: alpha/beta hydrolase fold domain-containing protein [Planctomycetota bacterium]